jgi:ribosomal protein S18 acetylase RimI-like enzyme
MNEEIFELTVADSSSVEPINHLLTQLTSSPVLFTIKELQAMVESPASHLFLLRSNDKIVGMLTLCTYLAPTGRKYWIEDVVVDSEARGKSYGRSLVQHAIEFARNYGAGSLMLTSKPARVAANALYRASGFNSKETNVYVMPLQ